MRQVMLQIDLSLDGFVAGPNDDTSWVKDDPEMNDEAEAVLDTVDTIMLGRVAYEQFVTFWPHVDMNGTDIASRIARHLNPAQKIIFSKTLDKATWGTWNNARVVSRNIAEEIAAIKAQEGKNLMLYAGAEIAAAFIQLGLVDEYRLRFHPVVLGGGKTLFRDSNTLDLKLVTAKQYKHGVVLLNYLRP